MATCNGGIGWFFKAIVMIVLGIVALKLLFVLFGVALNLGAFLLFTVAPVIVIGWLAVKAFQFFTRPSY